MDSNTPKRSLEDMNQLLRHTIAPQQKGIILEFIRTLQDEFDEAVASVNRHKSRVWMLELKQSRIKKTLEHYQSFLAPVHRLPSEILQEIFQHVCESNLLGGTMQLPSASIISMVSSRWRQVALSSPRIWSSLRISVPRHRGLHGRSIKDEKEKFIQRLQLYLERSQPSPLTLDIVDWVALDSYHEEAMKQMKLIQHSLNDNSSRWEVLRISGCGEDFLNSLSSSPTPNLRHLEFAIYYSYVGQERQFERFKGLENTSSLVSVSIDLTNYCPDSVSLPWANLRTLELFGGDPWTTQDNPLFKYLSQAGNLERMNLVDVYGEDQDSDVDSDTDPTNEPTDFIKLDAMKTLSIRTSDSIDLSILHPLRFPNLSNLILDQYGEEWEEEKGEEEEGEDDEDDIDEDPKHANGRANFAHLKDFLTHSCTTLTSFRMLGLNVTDAQLISVLQLLPSLTTVDISEQTGPYDHGRQLVTHRFTDHLLAPPVQPNETGCFLPKLAQISLLIHLDGLDQQALSDALASRCLPVPEAEVTSLKRIDIKFILKPEAEVPLEGPLAALECFKDFGVRYTVSHYTADSSDVS